MVFEDIKPGAALHYLAIPKRHIRDITHLKPQDIDLVMHLRSVGEQTLEKNGFTGRMGYHEPPFNSMFHLHMHIVGLPLLNNKKKLNEALVSPETVINNIK